MVNCFDFGCGGSCWDFVGEFGGCGGGFGG